MAIVLGVLVVALLGVAMMVVMVWGSRWLIAIAYSIFDPPGNVNSLSRWLAPKHGPFSFLRRDRGL